MEQAVVMPMGPQAELRGELLGPASVELRANGVAGRGFPPTASRANSSLMGMVDWRNNNVLMRSCSLLFSWHGRL